MPEDKPQPCTCGFEEQLHCLRFQLGECNQKTIPGTFGHPKSRFGRISRPAPIPKKTNPRSGRAEAE